MSFRTVRGKLSAISFRPVPNSLPERTKEAFSPSSVLGKNGLQKGETDGQARRLPSSGNPRWSYPVRMLRWIDGKKQLNGSVPLDAQLGLLTSYLLVVIVSHLLAGLPGFHASHFASQPQAMGKSCGRSVSPGKELWGEERGKITK